MLRHRAADAGRRTRAAVIPDELETAAAVLEPYYQLVQETYTSVEIAPGEYLDRLRSTRMVVSHEARDAERHYARCRDDGLLVELAPECIHLPQETLYAILLHELGHAADFAYPARFVGPDGARGRAIWIPEDKIDERPARRWRTLWNQRTDDQIEWAADAIARAVTGYDITYCGPCMLQCFSPHGVRRPPGLR